MHGRENMKFKLTKQTKAVYKFQNRRENFVGPTKKYVVLRST